MGSSAFAGKTVVMERNTGAEPPTPPVPGSWAEFVEVTEIGDLALNRSVYDATSHGASIYRDQLLGVVDAVNIDITCNLTGGLHYDGFFEFAGLGSTTDPDLSWYRILYPDGYYHLIEGYIGGITSSTPLDEKVTFKLKMVCTQEIQYINT